MALGLNGYKTKHCISVILTYVIYIQNWTKSKYYYMNKILTICIFVKHFSIRNFLMMDSKLEVMISFGKIDKLMEVAASFI